MPKSTVENVRLTAAELAGVNNDSIKLFIDDAWLEVDALPFKEDVKEKACRYLACHLAVLNNQNTKSEQVGSLKKSIRVFTQLYRPKRTVYGQEYLRLYNEYAKKGSLSLVVI